LESGTREDSEFTPTAEFDGHKRSVIYNSKTGLSLTLHAATDIHACTVVLVPGWSGPRAGPAEILIALADRLAKEGWNALRVDMPARGDSDGAMSECGLDEMIEATNAVAKDALWSNGASTNPVHVIGICSGGNVALGVVPMLSTDAKVVAISTFPFQRSRSKDMDKRRRWKNLKNYAAKAFSPSTWARLLRGEINVDRVKKNLNASDAKVSGSRNLKDSVRDIEAELSQWKGRALFVWGGGDEEAPPSRAHFEKLHADGMGQNCEFVTVPGANHNFYGQAWREELFERIAAFLKK